LIFKFQNNRTAKFPRIDFFDFASYIFPFNAAKGLKKHSCLQ